MSNLEKEDKVGNCEISEYLSRKILIASRNKQNITPKIGHK